MTPVPTEIERLRVTGISWLLTCDGPARGPLHDWQQLGWRGPCELLLERRLPDRSAQDARLGRISGLAAPWTLVGLDYPGAFAGHGANRQVDLGGVGLTPAWVDCHTHAVFAGDRAAEFNQRLAGRSYADIAASGGGILHTMAATRAASVAELVASATPRLEQMLAWGTAVVEIKTGYGLDLASEVRQLKAITQLGADFSGRLEVVATAMPGHAIAPEFAGDPDGYVDAICTQILPAMAAAAPCAFVDVFIEDGYFNIQQADRIADAGAALGMALKAHVDEFVDLGGVAWAVERGAVSVEHLLVSDARAIATLADSATTAVCLPLTSVFLRADFAPMRALVDAGCEVAIATDCNPGSAMSTNLHLAMQMAVLGGRLTPQEALRAVTVGGASALRQARSGRLRIGAPFHATVLAVDGPDRLFYELGAPPRAVHSLQAQLYGPAVRPA